MKEIPVSVCISAHNAGKFLPRCLDSVVNQTLSPIEIVLVNNGSTDNSLEIMEKYKKEYPNVEILIISQEDKGIALGKQTAVNHAHGSYIAFLDADDYVFPRTYEKMYKAAIDNDADIVQVQSIRDGVAIGPRYTNLQNTDKVFREILTARITLPNALWSRLFRKNLFNKRVFPDFYCNADDIFAAPCLIYSAKNIFYINEILHVWSTDNENSVTISASLRKDTNKEFSRRKNYLKAIKHVWNFVGEEEIIRNYSEEFKAFTAAWIARFIFTDLVYNPYSERIAAVRNEMAYFKNARTHDIELFVKRNIAPSNKLYRCIKILGLRLTFIIYMLRQKYKRRKR